MEKKLTWDDLVAVDLAEPSQREKTIEDYRRERNAQIDEQIELIRGVKKTKQVGDKTKDVTPWFKQEKGVWKASVFFSTRRLKIKGKKAIEAGAVKESLIPVYEAIKQGIDAGFMDEQMNEASKSRKAAAARRFEKAVAA